MTLYRVHTLAKRWECSESLVYKLIRQGLLTPIRLGTLIRISPEEVERFECLQSRDSGEAMPSSGKTVPVSDIDEPWMPETGRGRKRKRVEFTQPVNATETGRWAA